MSLAKRFTRMVAAIDPSSTLAIADGQPFADDSVYRVLNEERFCFTMLTLDRLKAVRAITGGYLVLDDSFILRYSSGKFNLKKLKDSAHNRYAHGFNVVLLIWTNGTIRIPVGFKVFLAQKGESSKIDLALELLKEARGMGLQPKYVLFDAWYSAERILNWVGQAGRLKPVSDPARRCMVGIKTGAGLGSRTGCT